MKKIFITYCLIYTSLCLAQHTEIADTNFRNYLKSAFASYMNEEGKLIDSLAFKFNGTLNCSNRNIKSLKGIEKFRNLKGLICSENALVEVDSIVNLTFLEELICQNNSLIQLPNLERLGNLVFIRTSHNQLMSLPSLHANLKLKTLQVDGNKITEIRGVDKLINLEYLILYDNNISFLPDLSALQNLTLLECHGNKLDTLVGLSNLKNLKILVTGNNLFKSTGDFSGLSNLQTLGYWVNQVAEVPDISQLVNLVLFDFNNNKLRRLPSFTSNVMVKQLYAQDNMLDSVGNLSSLVLLEELHVTNNNLKSLPSLTNAQSTLKEVYVDQNGLEALPDFTGYDNMKGLKVQNNRLTFEDIEPLIGLTHLTTLEYTPQKEIRTVANMTLRENGNLLWVLGIDKLVTHNSYEWYKDGVLIRTTTTDSLSIPNVKVSDVGAYTCIVKNSKVTNLNLRTGTMRLSVVPCIDLDHLKYETSEISCGRPATLIIDQQSIVSADRNFTYSLLDTLSGHHIYFSDPTRGGLFHNNYILTVSNSSNCSNSVNIELNGSAVNCDKGIILATGEDPARLSFFIEGSGSVKIYNKSGAVVKTLNAPAYWDGKLDSGEIIPGLYVVEVNSKYLEVTVIK